MSKQKQEEFNKVIGEIVVALEKAGVYDNQLKKTIDNLFHLKDLVLIREVGQDKISCADCRNYTPITCARGTCGQLKDFEVTKFFYCKYYIKK